MNEKKLINEICSTRRQRKKVCYQKSSHPVNSTLSILQCKIKKYFTWNGCRVERCRKPEKIHVRNSEISQIADVAESVVDSN